MADYTLNEVAFTPEQPTDSVGIMDSPTNINVIDEAARSRDEASGIQKFGATFETAAKSNWLVDAISDFQTDSHIKRTAELGNSPKIQLDDSTVEATLVNRGIDSKYFKYVRESETEYEFGARLRQVKSEQNMDTRINETIGKAGRITGAIVGSLSTPEVILGVGVGGLYGASSSVMKVAALEGGVEAFSSTLRLAVDDKYTAEDAFIDTMLGTAIATGVFKAIVPRQMDADTLKTTDSIAKDTVVKADPTTPTPKQPSTPDLTAEEVTQNRKNFFDTQKRLSADPEYLTKKTSLEESVAVAKIDRTKAIDEITEAKKPLEARLTSHNDALKAIEDIPANSGKIKYRKREIAKIQKDIAKLNDDVKAIDTAHGKKVGELSDTLKALETPTPKKSDAEMRFEESVGAMADDIDVAFRQLNDIVKAKDFDAKAYPEIKEYIDELYKRFPDEFEELRKLVRSKSGNKADVQGSKIFGKLDKKGKIAITALALSGTSLLADDGSGSGFGAETLVIALALGLVGYKTKDTLAGAIRNANLRKSVNDFAKSFETNARKVEIETNTDVGTVRQFTAGIADKGYTALTSTSAPFIKAGGKAKDFIAKILFSKDFGAGSLNRKVDWMNKTMDSFSTSEKTSFKEWKEEMSLRHPNATSEMVSITEFRNQVTDVVEGLLVTESKSLNNMADEVRKSLKDMLEKNQEYGTFGFDKITFTNNYIPRLWKGSVINDMFRRMSPDDISKVRDALSTTIVKKSGNEEEALSIANKFIESWTTGFSTINKATKVDVVEMLGKKGLLAEDAEIDDILDAITGSKDRNARAKYRIDFDLQDFKDELEALTVDIDGVPTRLSLNHFLDRDAKSIVDRTGNQLYSSASLSYKGITSTVQLQQMVKELPTALQDDAQKIADIASGVPLEADNAMMHTISNMMKDLTIGGKLPLVAFSTPTEIVQTVFNGGFVQGMRSIGDILSSKVFGKESELVAQLEGINSLGTSLNRLDMSFYGYSDDMLELTDADVLNKFRQGTMKFRDAVIYISGLPAITDLLQRANRVNNSTQFANFLHGSDTINKSRLISYGITEESLALFDKNMFDILPNGELKRINMEGWTQKQKDTFSDILFNMNQQYSPETTVGETALFTRTSSLGRFVSALGLYAMQQYNVMGLQGLKHLDKTAGMQVAGGVIGTYIGLKARYGVQGKEVDEELLWRYSIMNMPQLLSIGAAKSILDPAVVSNNESMMQMAGLK